VQERWAPPAGPKVQSYINTHFEIRSGSEAAAGAAAEVEHKSATAEGAPTAPSGIPANLPNGRALTSVCMPPGRTGDVATNSQGIHAEGTCVSGVDRSFCEPLGAHPAVQAGAEHGKGRSRIQEAVIDTCASEGGERVGHPSRGGAMGARLRAQLGCSGAAHAPNIPSVVAGRCTQAKAGAEPSLGADISRGDGDASELAGASQYLSCSGTPHSASVVPMSVSSGGTVQVCESISYASPVATSQDLLVGVEHSSPAATDPLPSNRVSGLQAAGSPVGLPTYTSRPQGLGLSQPQRCSEVLAALPGGIGSGAGEASDVGISQAPPLQDTQCLGHAYSPSNRVASVTPAGITSLSAEDMEALNADNWDDDSDIEVIPACLAQGHGERIQGPPGHICTDPHPSHVAALQAPHSLLSNGPLQPAVPVNHPGSGHLPSNSLPPTLYAALKHACTLWLDNDTQRFAAHLGPHPLLAGVPEADRIREIRAHVLDFLSDAIVAAEAGVLLQECLLGFACVPAGVLFAVRVAEGGLVCSIAAGPVGMPDAFLAEVRGMDRWAGLVDVPVLTAAMEGLTVRAALEMIATGYGLAEGLPC
jgi:hypothetical protein